jgi:DNA-binding protein YbaB
MFDMMGQLGDIQKRAEEMKKRMNNNTVTGEAEGIKATVTANRKLVNIEISDELIKAGDKEQLEDLVTIAINRALEKAEGVNEAETAAAYKDLLPPGFGM